jgi:hypothetical protein
MSIDWNRLHRHPAIAAVVVAIALFVAVSTVVAAIRQGSWGPVWATGWLPAVLVASLARTDSTRRRRRLRRGAQH